MHSDWLGTFGQRHDKYGSCVNKQKKQISKSIDNNFIFNSKNILEDRNNNVRFIIFVNLSLRKFLWPLVILT